MNTASYRETGPLHAHLMRGGATYAALAASLAPDYRVITADQRGHGDSSHAASDWPTRGIPLCPPLIPHELQLAPAEHCLLY